MEEVSTPQKAANRAVVLTRLRASYQGTTASNTPTSTDPDIRFPARLKPRPATAIMRLPPPPSATITVIFMTGSPTTGATAGPTVTSALTWTTTPRPTRATRPQRPALQPSTLTLTCQPRRRLRWRPPKPASSQCGRARRQRRRLLRPRWPHTTSGRRRRWPRRPLHITHKISTPSQWPLRHRPVLLYLLTSGCKSSEMYQSQVRKLILAIHLNKRRVCNVLQTCKNIHRLLIMHFILVLPLEDKV